MRIFRTIKASELSDRKRRKDGVQRVLLYSGFFSSVKNNIMCTNAMYETLLKEITGSLAPYSEKDSIELAVYHSSSASDDVRESVLVGFRKYVDRLKRMASSRIKFHFSLFFGIFALGVLIEFLLYGGVLALPEWINNVFDIVAWVFVWQFAAYMTFEFSKEKRQADRLQQIENIAYDFTYFE